MYAVHIVLRVAYGVKTAEQRSGARPPRREPPSGVPARLGRVRVIFKPSVYVWKRSRKLCLIFAVLNPVQGEAVTLRPPPFPRLQWVVLPIWELMGTA